jgi:hypothetical protein
MKPSEIRGWRISKAPDPETDGRARSSLAEPPISDDEASNAEPALCPRHGGIVGQRGEHFGMVFWCPTGKECFRYTRKPSRRRINYPARGYP